MSGYFPLSMQWMIGMTHRHGTKHDWQYLFLECKVKEITNQ